MCETITPEKAGISSENVYKFIKVLEKRGLAMHSVLMMRGENIFAEYYWKPFNEAFCHRMYSQTKSFVGVAVGLLEEDGLIRLDDKIADYFPEKIDIELPVNLKNLTIKDMLTMQTCGDTPLWFYNKDPDRVHIYFNQNSATMLSGMRWSYDSPGSQVLSCLVEKLSGMSLFEFLRTRIFDKLGTFKTASILKTKTEDSFGDSAMLCTTRDIASFARFVMNYGTWNGERIMNENYLKTATSRVVDNCETGFDGVFTDGYGYQIWRYGQDGFAFNGMGCQLTICIPEKDFIFACTSDNQGFAEAKSLILTALDDIIIENLGEPLPENEKEYKKCIELKNDLKLCVVKGNAYSPKQSEISDKIFICDKNLSGIERFSLHFNTDGTGELRYTNAQGDKVLPFGMSKNVFTKFPQYGYSDIHAALPTDNGFLYDCAVSAAWAEDEKLLIKAQVIDKYFGNLIIMLSFKNNRAVVRMKKHAEAFMDEYEGEFTATYSRD